MRYKLITHIFILLIGIVISVSSCFAVRSNHGEVESELSMLLIALETFSIDLGRYPTTSEGLDSLLTRPSSIDKSKWQGPYIDTEEIFKDPWKNKYIYELGGKDKDIKFHLYSLGKDGVSYSNGNDADDVNILTFKKSSSPLLIWSIPLSAFLSLIVFFIARRKICGKSDDQQ